MSRFAKLVNAQFQKKQENLASQNDTSLPQEGRQPREISQPPESSQPLEQPGARHSSSQPQGGSQPQQISQPPEDTQNSVDLIASLPEVAGRLELPYQIVDHLLRLLDPYEQAVYMQLFRLSWGFNKPSCSISNPKLAVRTGMPESTVKKTLVKLRTKGLIKKTGMQIGYGKEQGIDFWVSAPSSQLQRTRQLRDSRQLPQGHNKITNTQKENTQTQDGVSVGSKFSLEECKRYADHLKSTGQGITNPGGYATKIHRSGEADSLIEKFINPAPKIDVSKCPDCEGKGYYFPDPSKPETKRCTHERLQI